MVSCSLSLRVSYTDWVFGHYLSKKVVSQQRKLKLSMRVDSELEASEDDDEGGREADSPAATNDTNHCAVQGLLTPCCDLLVLAAHFG